MEIIRSIILGIVQGLTEFLPVSSSGHLELAKYILGDTVVGSDSMMLTVILHIGTALSTIYVFRKEIYEIIMGVFSKEGKEHRQFALLIIISMIPAAFVGLFFEKQLEALFTQDIKLVCGMLLITALLLYVASKSKATGKQVGYKEAILIGIAQAIAITPGISRSGATISSSVLLGIDREKAAKFSFLMVVPLIFGKVSKDLLFGEYEQTSLSFIPMLFGFLASFITGVVACKVMIEFVKRSKFQYFSYYCLIVGLSGIIYASFK
jgi:undecaprenyl-diphosphatase